MDLMTLEEVAERLRVPVPTLRYWRARGEGPNGFKLGGRLRYRCSDVEAWIEEQYAATTTTRSAS